MKIRAAVCTGLGEPWKTEVLDVGEPHAHEVQVELAYAGMCHSDEHLRTGDITAPPELLELLEIPSMFPCVGATRVRAWSPRSAPRCPPSPSATTWRSPSSPPAASAHGARRRQYLCDLGMTTLAGPMISDGTWRYHLDGQKVNRMTQLGTFAESMVVHESSLVKIDPNVSLRAAASSAAASRRASVPPSSVGHPAR